MDETNQNSDSNKVLDYHSTEECNSYYMMYGHLPVVVAPFSDCPVLDEVAQMVAHWHKRVDEEAINLWS